MTFTYNTITFTLTDGIGHLVMNQPPSNRMTIEFFDELTFLVNRFRQMKELKAMIISGSGRHFSSGADLDELLGLVDSGTKPDPARNSLRMNEFINRNYEAFLFFKKCEIPVISAIRGVCLGSAWELALLSHFRFCGEDAVLGLPETTFNLLPGVGGISGMVELVEKAVAMELILSGITFPAEDALKLKLVDRIVPKREVVSYAFDFAKAVMNNYQKGKKELLLQKVEQTILPS